MSVKILFVEDDERLRDILLEATAADGYQVEGVTTAEQALERLHQEAFDIVVTDVMLPGMSGLDLIPNLYRVRPGLVTMVITAHGTISMAVEAMKRGATDFLTKPFELDDLSGAIRVAAERVHQQATQTSPLNISLDTMVATSPVMRKLIEQVNAIAQFNTTVLITGETGTGKELVARAIHNASHRRHRPMVSLNCAAVPEQLLEDELFGHVKGAFTGANNAREGRFEQANGSTLFLDEIGDMSLPLQSKLLRVLQEREFEKLGSSRTVKVDVRIVAATSATLTKKIEEGSFRSDLFYRLNVVHLKLPPLRERPGDINPLAEHLLVRFCQAAGLPAKTITDEAWKAILSYNWPGNVRQLQNAMERAAALTGAASNIHLQDLPEEVRGGSPTGITPILLQEMPAPEPLPDEGVNFDAVVTKVERELLLQSLNKAGGNKMRAAKLLNMKRTTFVEKLKRLQISTGDEA
jgi:two-component system, NtrC family, response regulator AtoC